MKTEEVGVIRYGNLRFRFEISEAVQEYLIEHSIENQAMFPRTQFFYQGVLMKLGIDYEEAKELRVIFHGIRLEGEGVTDIPEEGDNKFDNFPIHVDDVIYFTDFIVEVQSVDRKPSTVD
ncbi:MAG: hypothetical protein PF542_06995 [Nanoarchaeota archaeon]|jgi:hypothetical protein|nr:hypothetical protein [Nanoarchaeota archaeon]